MRFTPVAWRRLWGWLAPTAALVACLTFMRLPDWIGWVTIVGALMLLADLYVVALEAIGAPGFEARRTLGQRAAAERRLLASVGLVALLLAIVGMLLIVLVLGVTWGVASTGEGFRASDPATWSAALDARGKLVVAAVGAAGAAGVAWVALRLAYAPIASVARARVQALSAWPLSRGVALKTAIGLLLVNVPAGLMALLAMDAASGTQVAFGLALSGLAGVLVGGLALPLNAGLMTYLFAQITRDPPDA
ncbi:MAG TPA: hypothetical protein VFE03_09615 [Caulobacteraceae bacterium]|nr:hypothetical protein [Caulobacteraceae bacterium]